MILELLVAGTCITMAILVVELHKVQSNFKLLVLVIAKKKGVPVPAVKPESSETLQTVPNANQNADEKKPEKVEEKQAEKPVEKAPKVEEKSEDSNSEPLNMKELITCLEK